MKFCVEAAVSAAQGGTAVRPPPPHEVRNLTRFAKKKIIFFHSENQLKKKFVAGKVRLLAPRPTHLVYFVSQCHMMV